MAHLTLGTDLWLCFDGMMTFLRYVGHCSAQVLTDETLRDETPNNASFAAHLGGHDAWVHDYLLQHAERSQCTLLMMEDPAHPDGRNISWSRRHEAVMQCPSLAATEPGNRHFKILSSLSMPFAGTFGTPRRYHNARGCSSNLFDSWGV